MKEVTGIGGVFLKKYLLLLITCFPLAAIAQPGTDIILFDIAILPAGITLSNPQNITNHAGYDNQPFFHRSNVYYSSQADSAQMDIRRYDYLKKTTFRITHTEDNEFSPTVTPDGKFISCILQRKNGKQDLIKYPINGGAPVIIIDNLKVGYHTWVTNKDLLLFVLEDTATFGLHHYNTGTKKNKRITDNIGRGLIKIPGRNAVGFIQKDSMGWLIKEYNASTGSLSRIIQPLENRDFLVWTKKGLILMSDGTNIYFKNPLNTLWQQIEVKSNQPLKNITRLALNNQNTKLAVVVSE